MFPRKEGKAKYYRVFVNEEVDNSTFGVEKDDYSERVLKECQRLDYDLVYGDCVRVGKSEYRNDGIMIYDGEKMVHLEYRDGLADYGFIPKEFTVFKHNKTDEYVPPGYYLDFYAGVNNFHPDTFLNREFKEEKKLLAKDIITLSVWGDDDEYYYVKINDDASIISSTDLDVSFLNKFIHSGMIVTTIVFPEIADNVYLIEINENEKKEVESI